MKKLILFLLIAASAYPQIISGNGSLTGNGSLGTTASGPTISSVQGCVNSASSSLTATCAMGSSITSGNLLVVTSKTENTTGTGTISVTSSSGVSCTWVQAVGSIPVSSGSGFNTAMYTCNIPSTGAETIQVTWSGTTGPNFTDIAVTEYQTSTSWKATVLDQSQFAYGSTSTTSCATGTTSATTNANDLIIAISQNFNSAETWGSLAGWTNRAASSRNTTGWYDQVVTSTGAQSATIPFSAADTCTGMIAAFASN